MMKLEGESIGNFNPDRAINYWFDVAGRRPGGAKMKGNLKDAKEAGECSKEVSEEVVQDDDDEVEMQDVQMWSMSW